MTVSTRPRLAALLGLWALAMAQPILDLVGRQPDFLVAHRFGRAEVVSFALGLSWVPPLLLGGILAGVTRVLPGLGRWLFWCFAGALAGTLALHALGRSPLDGRWVLVLAALAAALTGVLLARLTGAARFAAYLAPAALVVPLYFLALSPARQLLAEQGAVEHGTGTSTTPLVLLILDELPTVSLLDANLEIDAERFPNFARLAREATWFRDATTVAERTVDSLPAMLSGVRPGERLVAATAANHPRTLFQLLGRSHRLWVREQMTQLCPVALCKEERPQPLARRVAALAADLRVVAGHLFLPAELRWRLPPIDKTWRDFDADAELEAPSNWKLGAGAWHAADIALVGELLDSLEATAAGDRPAAHIVHLMLPHEPWRLLPSGRRVAVPGGRASPEGNPPSVWEPGARGGAFGWQQHLLQLAYTDRLLGRILDRLQTLGAYERTVVAVVADHGTSFAPGTHRRELTQETFREILHVPLIVKRAGRRSGEVVDHNVETLDLFPTLAAAVGVGVPWAIEGRDLFAPDFAPRPEKIAHNHGPRNTGRSTKFPAGRLGESRQLARRLDLFGAGPAEDLLRYGPLPEWVGRPVADLPRGAPSDFAVQLADASAFTAVDPAVDPLANLLVGRLIAGRLDEGARLAIALNGVIAATTWSEEVDGGLRVRALVPPSLLRAGRNEVEIFLVEGHPPRLRASSGRGAPAYKLGEAGIEAEGGQLFPWGSARPVGEARWVGNEIVGTLRTRPWRGPVELVLFADRRFLGAVALRPPRPPRRPQDGAPARHVTTRFAQELPADLSADAKLRVFALLDGEARRVRVGRKRR